MQPDSLLNWISRLLKFYPCLFPWKCISQLPTLMKTVFYYLIRPKLIEITHSGLFVLLITTLNVTLLVSYISMKCFTYMHVFDPILADSTLKNYFNHHKLLSLTNNLFTTPSDPAVSVFSHSSTTLPTTSIWLTIDLSNWFMKEEMIVFGNKIKIR